MSLLCFLGRHKPSTASIGRNKDGGHRALCDSCGSPLERLGKGSWRASDPLAQRQR